MFAEATCEKKTKKTKKKRQKQKKRENNSQKNIYIRGIKIKLQHGFS